MPRTFLNWFTLRTGRPANSTSSSPSRTPRRSAAEPGATRSNVTAPSNPVRTVAFSVPWSSTRPLFRCPRKCRTWLMEIAYAAPLFTRPRFTLIRPLMPISFPACGPSAANSGPPELPGFTLASTCRQSVYSRNVPAGSW